MPMPRKSPEEHALTGTKVNYPIETTNSRLAAGRPKYPKGISQDGRRLFKRLCNQLASRRALTEGDEYLLRLFVETWERRARAQANLLAQGEICEYTRLDPNGVAHKIEKPNLNLKVIEVADKQLVAYLDRLGLSPLAGSKVKQTRQTEESEEAQPGTVAWLILNGGKDSK